MTSWPAAELQQRLHPLSTASFTTRHQPKLLLIARWDLTQQAQGEAKGAPFTKAEQGLHTVAQKPGLPGHQADLLPQGHFPASRMHAGCGTKASNRTNTVMTGGGTAIRRCQKQQAVEAQSLKDRLNQAPRSPKGIEVDEIEPLTLKDRPIKQQICRLRAEPR